MSLGKSSLLTRRLAIALAFACAMPSSFGEVTTEVQLKAAYLVNFLKYVEFPGNRTSVTLCLFGRDSVGPYLARYEGRQIAGRELHIRKVSSPEQLADCQELFIPDTEESRVPAVLRWVGKQAILTVSDSETFIRDGGVISLVRAEGRLQFEVSPEALGRANLKASSQMLRLARQSSGGAR